MDKLDILISVEIDPFKTTFSQFDLVMLASGKWETFVPDKSKPDGKNIGIITLDREVVYGTGFSHLSTKYGHPIWPLSPENDNGRFSKIEIAIAESEAIGCGKEYAASKLGKLGGSSTSKRKAKASRANGRKGGRPRKKSGV
jgi:hypothetical protein